MKKITPLFILVFLLFNGKIFAQCVDAGGALSAICKGGTTGALGGSYGGEATSATWDDGGVGGSFTNNSSGHTPGTATYTPPASFTGTITLTLTSQGGSCDNQTASKTLKVDAPATADAGAAMSDICENGISGVLGGSVGGGATGGTWSTTAGGTFSPSATDLNATWSPGSGWSGTATLVLTATGSACGDVTASKQINVNGPPAANSLTQTVCEDTRGGGSKSGVDLTQLDNSITASAANCSVTWYSNAGRTVTVATPTSVTVTNGLVFYPRVTNSVTTCTNDATVTYTVDPKPVAGSVSITGSLSQGASLTANYSYLPGACNPEVLSKTEISWYVADDNSGTNATWVATKAATDKTYLLTAADAGKYIQISVKVSDGTLPLASPVTSTGWYGPVTANTQPVASGVAVSGTPKVNNLLTGIYTYYDAEGDPEGASVYSWFRGDDASGTNPVLITGATSRTYQLTNSELGKYIGFKVKPIAVSGDMTGVSVISPVWLGQVTNDPPVASGVNIGGTPKVSSVLSGNYTYSDTEGDVEGNSVFQWYRGTSSTGAGKTAIGGATSRLYQLTNNEFGYYIGFEVTPVASTGTLTGSTVTTTTWVGPVTNPPPTAIISGITGTKNVNDALIGNYTYSDAEGDIESGSLYEWSSSSTLGGTYTLIPGETSQTHVVKMTEQGKFFKFSVTPKTTTGSTTGAKVTTPAGYGPANSKPVASSVNITGTPLAVGTTLTATFTYFDADSDPQGTTLYRWFRDGVVVAGQTSSTYLLTTDDGGSIMSVEVTPVATTGYPNQGDPVTYTMSSTVDDPSNKPVASNVCVDGKRMVDSVLTGRYIYTYSPKSEGTSWYKWYNDGVAIPGATSIHYTLTSADLDHNIQFEVTPRSSNSTPKVGDPVMSHSLARFTLDKTSFIATDSDKVLTASPTGGYFWGKGVLNGKFSPRSVDYTINPDTVNYHLNDYNCSQDAVTYLTVNGVTAYFQGFNSFYCQNGGYDTIVVKNVPSIYIYKYFYITNYNAYVSQPNDSTIVIDPSKLTPGNGYDWLYFYAYDYYYTTYLQIQNPFDIEAIKDITISGILPNDEFCHNDSPLQLYVNQPGGTWSGGAVTSSGVLDPSMTTGNKNVIYAFASPRGCVSSATVPVLIHPLPSVSFAAADSCILNLRDTTRFLNYSSPDSLVATWSWAFSDGGLDYPSNLRQPGYLYKTGGIHKIRLTAHTIDGCSLSDEENIEFGFRPVADFRWKNDCMHPNDSIYLFDSTTTSTNITSRSWNFFDGDSLHTVLNPVYPKKAVGYDTIQYIVNTKYYGCSDTITKKIYIRPTYSLAGTDYSENFENGNGGWVKNYDTLNTWSFGTPDRTTINSAASGTHAWFTSFNPAAQVSEQSSIISPCFDFTNVVRPMITIKFWNKFDKNRDGAALQYRVGDSKVGNAEDWRYVGSLEDGINWFNSAQIQGRPGGEQLGWTQGTSLDSGWVKASHKLDDLIGRKDVKFRVVYGSNGQSQGNDGLAFDDIWIGSRSRGVLLEHFTNNSSADASDATALVSDLSNRWPEDIINIQYHTNFPGTDPYYTDNPGDASARILFYGLSGAPYTFIDGGYDKKNFAKVYDYVIASLDSNDVNSRSMVNPLFQIVLHGTVSSGVVTVSGKVKALQPVDVSNMTLYLAITQKMSNGAPGGNGETKYYNVLRKFIPDAGGISMKRTWAVNETDTISERSWTINNMPSGSDMEIIAFLQNKTTKDIYQAESLLSPNITVGIEDLPEAKGGFALYPNPASSKLVVTFEKQLTAKCDIRIYDYSGSLVKTFKTGNGGSEYIIDDIGLKSGIYLVRISSGGTDYGYKKLIVSER